MATRATTLPAAAQTGRVLWSGSEAASLGATVGTSGSDVNASTVASADASASVETPGAVTVGVWASDGRGDGVPAVDGVRVVTSAEVSVESDVGPEVSDGILGGVLDPASSVEPLFM